MVRRASTTMRRWEPAQIPNTPLFRGRNCEVPGMCGLIWTGTRRRARGCFRPREGLLPSIHLALRDCGVSGWRQFRFRTKSGTAHREKTNRNQQAEIACHPAKHCAKSSPTAVPATSVATPSVPSEVVVVPDIVPSAAPVTLPSAPPIVMPSVSSNAALVSRG